MDTHVCFDKVKHHDIIRLTLPYIYKVKNNHQINKKHQSRQALNKVKRYRITKLKYIFFYLLLI